MIDRLFEEPFDGSKEVSYFGLKPLYYKLETIKSDFFGEFERSVSHEEYMSHLFMANEMTGEVYGYPTNFTALNHIHGTSQVPVLQEIKTNNVSEICEYSKGFGIRYKLYPSDIKITSSNYQYLQLLDVLDGWFDYFEDDVVQTIKYMVEIQGLSYAGFKHYIENFSERTKGIIRDVFA